MSATIGKHPDKAGVWCVFVDCPNGTHGGVEVAYEDGPELVGPCELCNGTGKRILSTHSTRDGAVVSCNQLNRAERGQ